MTALVEVFAAGMAVYPRAEAPAPKSAKAQVAEVGTGGAAALWDYKAAPSSGDALLLEYGCGFRTSCGIVSL